MAKKLVKYQLENGSIPSNISDGGYYPDGSEVMLGVTIDNPSTTFLGEITSTTDTVTYLNSYTSDWTQYDPATDTDVPFDQDAAAANLWSKI